MAYTHALSTNNYGPAKIIVATSAANGTHTTLATAMADAVSGDTIFLRDSVTEDVTLTPGVNISSWGSSSSLNATGKVTITGTLTMTGAGSCTISGIQLQTNSAALLAVTGSAASIVNLQNCYLNCTNATGITYSSSSSSSRVNIFNCSGDIGTTGISLFAHSSAGQLELNNFKLSNSGGSTTASTCSAGNVLINYVQFSGIITTSSAAFITARFSMFAASNVTALNLNNTSNTSFLLSCTVGAGTASAISVGAGAAAAALNCEINSSNTNAITGSGTFSFASLSFSGSSSNINTTTQLLYNQAPTSIWGSTNSGNTNTITVTNTSNTATSAANVVATVAGSTAADATYQAIVSGVTTWTWGVDNSVTTPTADTWVLAQGTTLGTNNVMSVAKTGEINYPLQSAFYAYNSSTDSDVTGDNTAYTIICDTEVLDQNSDYNNSTGIFTAPVAGLYFFAVGITLLQLGASHTTGALLLITSGGVTNNLSNANYGAMRNAANNLIVSASVLINLAAAETVTYQVIVTGSTKTVDVFSGNGVTYFSGHLVV